MAKHKHKFATQKSKAVLDFIVEFWKLNHCSPSIREIGDGVGISSTSVVGYYLGFLERDGEILPRGENKNRNIVPAEIAHVLDAYFYGDE